MSDYGMYRALRGGSWCYYVGCAHAAYRSAGDPSDRFYAAGLRLSRRWM